MIMKQLWNVQKAWLRFCWGGLYWNLNIINHQFSSLFYYPGRIVKRHHVPGLQERQWRKSSREWLMPRNARFDGCADGMPTRDTGWRACPCRWWITKRRCGKSVRTGATWVNTAWQVYGIFDKFTVDESCVEDPFFQRYKAGPGLSAHVFWNRLAA